MLKDLFYGAVGLLAWIVLFGVLAVALRIIMEIFDFVFSIGRVGEGF